MSRRNLNTSLRRRSCSNPMAAFDALPSDLRRWLACAHLPWSARSAFRIWQRALRSTKGDRDLALAALRAAEDRTLARDSRRIWGGDYPAPATPPD
ncbi:MAG: DUF6525 family protein [Pseudodonghicola sp.]|nr:DUF6525 family protein [Pseudodonghicola sp.]